MFRFQTVAWMKYNGEPSMMHLKFADSSGTLCRAVGAIPDRQISEGSEDCMGCIHRGRYLQGRNVQTGEPPSQEVQ